MNITEVTYTDKYSSYKKNKEDGLKRMYYIQDTPWEVSQFEKCKVMENKYCSHKLLSDEEKKDILWNGCRGVIKEGEGLFELEQFNYLKGVLAQKGFTYNRRDKPKYSYSILPSRDVYTTPCGNFTVSIKEVGTWYEIHFGLSDKHPEYEIAKKYDGKMSKRIGYWMFHGTLERNNEMRSPSQVYNLIINHYRKIRNIMTMR